MAEEETGETPLTAPMLLTVIYDSGIDESVMAAIESMGLDGWTKLDGAHGFGGTGHKLDTPVWPGTNNILLIALPQEQAMTVAERLRALQASYRRKPGITLFLQPVSLL